MRLPSVILAATLLAGVSTAHAVPNMWISGSNMGETEYSINNPEKAEFVVNCTVNPDEKSILQHSVLVAPANGKMLSSQDKETDITVVIDNSQYPIPSFLGWRSGDNNWLSFIDALSKAADFDVYVNDKKIASFSPGIKNTQKVLSDLEDCRVIYSEDN